MSLRMAYVSGLCAGLERHHNSGGAGQHKGYRFHSQPSTYKIPPGADTEPNLAGALLSPITLRGRRPVLAAPLP